MHHEQLLNGVWDLRNEILTFGLQDAPRLSTLEDGWIPQPVPGDIHQGLMAAGQIKDPLLGMNSVQCSWLESRSWWLRKTFDVKAEWLDADAVELELDGLDSNAEIFLNDRHLGSHRNAFRPFVLDAKSRLKPGRNLLLVRLTTGVETVSDADLDEPDGIRAGTEAGNGRPERGDPRRVMVRKPQYTFGWDWSPRLATVAIAGDVKLRALRDACIRNVCVRPVNSGHHVAVLARVTVERLHLFTTREGTLAVTLTDAAGRKLRAEQPVLLRSGLNYVDFTMPLEDPRYWWPNGLGEQHLYKIETRLTIASRAAEFPAFDWGLRFLELDTTPGVFAVVVNGRRVYCKGGNYVPAEALYATATDERYETLVREARDAHFTMLRIWGGGWYEREAFYRACDRYGILIWHDFMFACAPYPDHLEWFRQEVEKEADYQIQRLQRHASLAVWSGNNENSWGFRDWWHGRTKGGAAIYNYILPRAVQNYSPEIPYWNSSPYGGETSPNCEDVGDRHHWGECMMNPDVEVRTSPEEYDKCNSLFVSEFGYIGSPCRETVTTYLDGAPVDRNSESWRHHTNTFEKGTVEAGIRRHYTDPERLDLDGYILYSGLCQGMMYSYALDSMRSRENCHGSLFWMYNDCWGEVGWTILDYYLRRKISWYFVRRAFAPLRLILRRAGDQIRILLANDTPKACTFDLEFGYLSLDGSLSDLQTRKAQAPALARTELCRFSPGSHDPTAGLWIARVPGAADIAPGVFGAVSFRQLRTTDPKLAWKVVGKGRNGCAVRVSSVGYAHAVALKLPPDAVPADNYFDLLPGERRQIAVSATAPVDPAAIRVTCANAP